MQAFFHIRTHAFTGLRSLEFLASDENFTGVGMSHIGKHLQQLTSLTITFATQRERGATPAEALTWRSGFATLPRTLRALTLVNHKGLVDTSVLKAIVQACPFLEKLHLAGVEKPTEVWGGGGWEGFTRCILLHVLHRNGPRCLTNCLYCDICCCCLLDGVGMMELGAMLGMHLSTCQVFTR